MPQPQYIVAAQCQTWVCAVQGKLYNAFTCSSSAVRSASWCRLRRIHRKILAQASVHSAYKCRGIGFC